MDWIELAQATDGRGRLTAVAFDRLPFVPARLFCVTDVPAGGVRGGHAHRRDDQILVCLSGRIEIELQAGGALRSIICEPDGRGLLVPHGVWSRQIYLERGSALLVLCSHPYDPADYVRDPETPTP